MNIYNQYQEPTKDEQIVQATVAGLKWAEERYCIDLSETISTLEWMYDTHSKQDWKLDGHELMAGYATASGRGVARRIVEANREGR